ncbi:hypothetical protein RhiJN_00727 [Ceratobasidium sp. AG-Ba]|nr:hypothetical protein RhiJN_00727 [Ceratobasidium sp. AG-Ba]QRW01762.1 hypothetical protein RhiLY_00759 [Ceratobasidium sp. AG-Ba]
MSSASSYIESLFQLGLERPTPAEFLEHPGRRIIAAFFLGWAFVSCLRYLALAALRHPFTDQIARSILQRPIPVTIAERQFRATTDDEGNIVQNWLHNTHLPPPNNKPDRPEGTRHLSVVLTMSFAIGILVHFLSFLDFESSKKDVLCFIVIAWAGISISCAKLAGLLRISFDLQRLGLSAKEKHLIRGVLFLILGAVLAHVTISIGAATDVPQIPGLTLCYRRHFPLTSFLVSGISITLEIYYMARAFSLLVPEFLSFRHKAEILMDVRVARIASILCLDLLTVVPAAIPTSITAEFVPFSLGTLLVLAAFNHHPPLATEAETRSLPTLTSHRTSIITFPTHNGRGNGSVTHSLETPKKSDILLPTPPSPPPIPTLAKAATRAPRRKSSIASHITYDSEAEARSVHGAVVSLAFKSSDVEPVPAIPYGLFQPKLISSPRLVAQSPQLPPKSPLSGGVARGNAGSTLSPRPRGSSILSPLPPTPKPEAKPLPIPQLRLTISDAPSGRKEESPNGSERTDSVVYGSDIIRRPTFGKPVIVKRAASTSTTGGASHGTTSPYTGLDLRHISMGSHSTSFETGDYSVAPARRTGFHRASILGPSSSENANRLNPRMGEGEPRPLSSIWLEPWVGGSEGHSMS